MPMKFTNELQLNVLIVKVIANVIRKLEGNAFDDDG